MSDSSTDPRTREYKAIWKYPEVQDLPVKIKLDIELAFQAEYLRGVQGSYRQGKVRGLTIARNLPRFTFRAIGKHIMGYVSVGAIDAELRKLGE